MAKKQATETQVRPFSFFSWEAQTSPTIRNEEGEEIENPFSQYATFLPNGEPRKTRVTLVVIQGNPARTNRLNRRHATYYYDHKTKTYSEYEVRIFATDPKNAYAPTDFDSGDQPIPMMETYRPNGSSGEAEERPKVKELHSMPRGQEQVMEFELPKDRMLVEQLILHPLNKYRFLEDGTPFSGSKTEADLFTFGGQPSTPVFFLRYEDTNQRTVKNEAEERSKVLHIFGSFAKMSADRSNTLYSPEVKGIALAMEHLRPNGFITSDCKTDEDLFLKMQAYVSGADVSPNEARSQRHAFFKFYERGHDLENTLLFRFARHAKLVQFNNEKGYHIVLPHQNDHVRLGLTEPLAITALGSMGKDDERKRYILEHCGFLAWREAWKNRKDGKYFNQGELQTAVVETQRSKIIDEQTASLQKLAKENEKLIALVKQANPDLSDEEILKLVK